MIKRRVHSIITFIVLCIIITITIRQSALNEAWTLFVFLSIFIYLIHTFKVSYYMKFFLFFSILIRMLFVLYQFKYNFLFFKDSYNYLTLNQQIMNLDIINISILEAKIGSLHIGYELLNVIIYKIFQTELALYLINIFLFLLTIKFLYSILEKNFSTEIATNMTIILNLSMNIFVFTGTILKDSLALFLLVASYYYYDKLLSEKNKLYLIIYILILLGITYYAFITRIYVGGSIVAWIGYSILNQRKFKKTKKYMTIIMAIIIGLLLMNYLSPYTQMVTNFISKIQIKDVIQILWQILYFLYSPLPWSFFSQKFSVYTLLIIDSLFMILATPFLLKSLIKFIENQMYRKKIFVYIIPILIHAIALGTQYSDGANRQKLAIFPFLILFVVLGNYNIEGEISR